MVGERIADLRFGREMLGQELADGLDRMQESVDAWPSPIWR